MKLETEKGVTVGEVDGKRVELPRDYRKWKMGQLGEERFNALSVRAHTHVKKDRKMALIQVKAFLVSLEKSLGKS